MGNCQAAEAATVLIQHPNNKIQRFYWSLSAHEVMNLNPGHYVALVLPEGRTVNGTPVKKLKLLRQDDTLVIGQVYRLISFQVVLKEFAAKKCVKLGKLLKERGVIQVHSKKNDAGVVPAVKLNPSIGEAISVKEEDNVLGSRVTGKQRHHHDYGGGGGGGGGIKQWKPALHSIAEIGN